MPITSSLKLVNLGVAALAFTALAAAPAPAEAVGSCSTFGVIQAYDADGHRVKVDYKKGSVSRFFPRPEGSPRDTSKVPKSCRGSLLRNDVLHVKETGGRLSITQVRSNFEGKMLNDTDDATWFSNQMKQLIEGKTEVVLVIRPGMKKDDPLGVSTIYLPITDAERAEIKRLEDQAEEVE